jgi:hypothetical protein
MTHNETFANKVRYSKKAVALFAATAALAGCGVAEKTPSADSAASGNVPVAISKPHNSHPASTTKPAAEQPTTTPTPVQAEMTPSEAQALIERLSVDPSINPLGLAIKEQGKTVVEIVERDLTDMTQHSTPPFKMPEGVSIEDIIKILPYVDVEEGIGSEFKEINPNDVVDNNANSVRIRFIEKNADS